MKTEKIRLHKAVINKVKAESLEYTKANIARNIEEYGVIVDGIKITKRLTWVWLNSVLEINHWPQREKGNLNGIEVLAETKDYLAVFKPYNLVVAPGAGHQKDNLISWLQSHFPEQKKMIKEAPEDSNSRFSGGLVHRLDKNTQGVLLIARSQKNLDFFQNQFRDRKVEKKYLAIIKGSMTQAIEIQAWQARSKKDPMRQVLFASESEAFHYDLKFRNNHSIFKPLYFCKELNQSLIEIEIKTGRMHQIRLQAEGMGFPLVSEEIYNSKTTEKLQLDYSLTTVKDLNEKEFLRLKKRIFNGQDYCLLSNYLKLKKPDGDDLIINYKNV